MESAYTTEGINAIKSGKFDQAFTKLHKAFFIDGDVMAGCYLAMMYFDVKITPRTPESQAKAMIIWNMTKDKVISSRHKLGVNLYGSKNPQTKNLGYQYISDAANAGYSVAHCVLGMLYHSVGQYDKAEKELLKYENLKNDKRACIALADCVIKNNELTGEKAPLAIQVLDLAINKFGDTSKKDAYDKAVESNGSKAQRVALYEEKARSGDITSILTVAEILSTGIINGETDESIKNPEKALEYLKLGADTYNDINCMFRYAELYGEYIWTIKDDVMPYKEKLNQRRVCIDYALRAVNGGYVDKESFIGEQYRILDETENWYNYCRENYYRHKSVSTIGRFEWSAESWYKAKNNKSYSDMVNFKDPIIKECIEQTELFLKDWNTPCVRLTLYPKYLFWERGEAGKMEAFEYFKLNPEISFFKPYLALGTIEGYYKGIMSSDEAVDALSEGADEYDPVALYGYGILMRYNSLYSNALEYFMKSYAKGLLKAADAISDMYLTGQITGRKDKKKAAEWKNKSMGE